MATPALVSADIEMGIELVEMLDKASFPVTAAAWIYSSAAEDWRLYIRTPKARENLLDALRKVATVMDANGDLRSRIDFSRIRLVPPDNKILAAMGSLVKAEGISTIRFVRNVVDGILVDDALIYRLAA